jgi:hypothetical protein
MVATMVGMRFRVAPPFFSSVPEFLTSLPENIGAPCHKLAPAIIAILVPPVKKLKVPHWRARRRQSPSAEAPRVNIGTIRQITYTLMKPIRTK